MSAAVVSHLRRSCGCVVRFAGSLLRLLCMSPDGVIGSASAMTCRSWTRQSSEPLGSLASLDFLCERSWDHYEKPITTVVAGPAAWLSPLRRRMRDQFSWHVITVSHRGASLARGSTHRASICTVPTACFTLREECHCTLSDLRNPLCSKSRLVEKDVVGVACPCGKGGTAGQTLMNA